MEPNDDPTGDLADDLTDDLTDRVETDEPVERPKAAPIDSRFLYVDIAAMRAKQLRRGARPRLADEAEALDEHRPMPHKAERIAMEEVRRGLVLYDVPPPKPPTR
jgi:DNA-directed RNA polymerase subunit K/omega